MTARRLEFGMKFFSGLFLHQLSNSINDDGKKVDFDKNSSFSEGKEEVKTSSCLYVKDKEKVNNFPDSAWKFQAIWPLKIWSQLGGILMPWHIFCKGQFWKCTYENTRIWLGTRLRIFWWWIFCPVQSFKTTAVSEKFSAEATWSGLLEVMLLGRWNYSGDSNAEIEIM